MCVCFGIRFYYNDRVSVIILARNKKVRRFEASQNLKNEPTRRHSNIIQRLVIRRLYELPPTLGPLTFVDRTKKHERGSARHKTKHLVKSTIYIFFFSETHQQPEILNRLYYYNDFQSWLPSSFHFFAPSIIHRKKKIQAEKHEKMRGVKRRRGLKKSEKRASWKLWLIGLYILESEAARDFLSN